MRRTLATLLAATALLGACAAAAPTATPQVLETIPHDPTAFTQGFELADGVLYEGTGLVGRSQLRELDPATGAVRRAVPIPAGLFGEGITVVGPTIWQLTWQDGVALQWDRATLTLLRQVPVRGEGWGLCFDGARLVRSDGTDRLHFHDPQTFAETGAVTVGATDLNELECVDGQVWANVWKTDRIVRIDPATGAVTADVDASGLLTAAQRADTDVLNGIAHLGGDEYLLTGKWWPSTFRVRLPKG
jgi:glutaminyl-peptide cyclotransferase